MPLFTGLAVAAGGALMGGIGSALQGNSGGTQNSNSSTGPWLPQQNYIKNGLSQAQTNYEAQQSAGPYTGNFVAGNNAEQGAASNQANNWVNGTGGQNPWLLNSTAQGLMGAANPYMNNAQGMAANGIGGPNQALMGSLNGYATGANPAYSSNPALMNSLNGSAINAAGTINALTSGQQNLMNMAMSDPTQQLASDAGAYMNSSPVQGAISSTNQAIQNNLNQSTLQNVDRTAAMGGGLNSTRTAMSEGMARQGAAMATGQADAGILNNAYNTGLSTAASQRSAGMNTAMWNGAMGMNADNSVAQGQQGAQIGASEFGTNASINAANSGLSQGLGYATQNANTMLGANNQLGNSAAMGINGVGQAGALATQNFGLGASSGGLQQQGTQNNLTNSLDQWNMQNGYQQGILSNYMSIVGHPYGSQSTGYQASQLPPNYMGNILGGGSMAGGLYNNYLSNMPSTSPNVGVFGSAVTPQQSSLWSTPTSAAMAANPGFA